MLEGERRVNIHMELVRDLFVMYADKAYVRAEFSLSVRDVIA